MRIYKIIDSLAMHAPFCFIIICNGYSKAVYHRVHFANDIIMRNVCYPFSNGRRKNNSISKRLLYGMVMSYEMRCSAVIFRPPQPP